MFAHDYFPRVKIFHKSEKRITASDLQVFFIKICTSLECWLSRHFLRKYDIGAKL